MNSEQNNALDLKIMMELSSNNELHTYTCERTHNGVHI